MYHVFVGFGALDDASCMAVTEQSLQSALFQFGEIKSIRIIPAKKCAFATFMERSSAERCMSQCGVSGVKISAESGTLLGNGAREVNVNLSWGKPAKASSRNQSHPQHPQQQQHYHGTSATAYPSMNPNAMGAR